MIVETTTTVRVSPASYGYMDTEEVEAALRVLGAIDGLSAPGFNLAGSGAALSVWADKTEKSDEFGGEVA